jgi:hypothetical protein
MVGFERNKEGKNKIKNLETGRAAAVGSEQQLRDGQDRH